MDSDKRRYPRVPTSIDITYFIKEPDKADDTPTHYISTVTDLSKGGACLVGEHDHSLDETLCIEGVDGYNAPLDGVVRWIENVQGQYRIGVEFPQRAT